jgi:cytidine diphosphoramidate kinase
LPGIGRNLPGYFEVYLIVPVEELRRRDSKGIYRRFDAGELANVAGLDLSIDEHEAAADSILEFLPELTVDAMVDELMNQLTERSFHENTMGLHCVGPCLSEAPRLRRCSN